MAREVSIGAQGFEQMRLQNAFLVDKTDFIAQWWNSLDHITLICRPRRFGKTLTLDMVRCFLSLEFSGRGEELFGDLAIWKNEHMQTLQGTTPVVMLSFADCKGSTLDESLASIRQVIRMTVESHSYLYDSTHITTNDHIFLDRVTDDMDIITATSSIKQLCLMLKKHWGIEPVVLLDEYDTPPGSLAWRLLGRHERLHAKAVQLNFQVKQGPKACTHHGHHARCQRIDI